MIPEHNEKNQYSILKKYFENSASEEEIKLVNQWLSEPEQNLQFENYLHMLWMETGSETRGQAIDLNILLDKIHHSINLRREKTKVRSLPRSSGQVVSFSHVLKTLARIAAILMLPVMGYLAWGVANQRIWVNNQAEVVYNEIICPLGARSQFELPDGTTGSLNNGSRLKYPVKFYGETREVELTGEAYFDVYKDKKRPFIINTDGLDVKVLGTKLNVYSYPDEGFQEFTLESGIIELFKKENGSEIPVTRMKPGQHIIYRFDEDKMNVEHDKTDKKSIVIKDEKKLNEFLSDMKPGQHAVYEMKDGNVNIQYDETDYYTAWKDGKLVLRNDPMPRLLKRIERWYNVKFNIIDESINEYTYWATFEEENLDQVLKLLSLTGPIRFEELPREKTANGTYKVQEINVMLKK